MAKDLKEKMAFLDKNEVKLDTNAIKVCNFVWALRVKEPVSNFMKTFA